MRSICSQGRILVVCLAVFGLAVTALPAAQRRKKQRGAKRPAASAPVAVPAEKPMSYEAALANLRFREIGPAIMGGRIDDFAVVEKNPDTVFVATASGGIWKTTNAGITWAPVFDRETVSTIGAITVAPSDPSLVWVGTGEANNRQSSSWGDGVYKSTDGGKTWTHTGLADTQHIGRIVIHPTNPDVVYVAALGHLWGANAERGLYKTTDAGKTWNKVLFTNDDTGVVDVAMDPESPDTLYAAAYERRRTVYGFNGGGPGSGLYKTTDGGATWKKLTTGLPGGDTGRIAVCVYHKNPNIIYALVQNKDGGVFRSEDQGETWKRMSPTDPRPSYFSRIEVDPNNDLRIWVLGARMYYSEDGGKTFRTDWVRDIHGDFHALWIDPADSAHVVLGSDGGIYFSHDGGRNWDFDNIVPLGQFYEVGYNLQKPYLICGGLQDNGAWCGPSRTWFFQGITNDDWYRVGEGDGFYVKPDLHDPDIVYAEAQDGNLVRRNLRTNEARQIRPIPKAGAPPYRFQWNTPLELSTHDPETIYYGGNFLFKSTDRGDTWTKLGGDLTTGVDRNTLPILGQLPKEDTLSRNDGVEWYPCITTISESPLSAAVLWVGTDDGNLQVTHDGGKIWRNVADHVPGVPKGTYVSRVVASRYAEGTAYVTFDGHRSNDFHVYLFRTTDYGETWKALSNGIPENDGTLHVVREDPRNPNLLFGGTEYGAYVSFDAGTNWQPLKMNLPAAPVDDIAVQPQESDLILGTHGRSIWILDDITPLERLDGKVLASDFHLFDIRPATEWRMYINKTYPGQKFFAAPNPPYGALIDYDLKAKAGEKEKAKITILGQDGKVVRELDGPAEAGINRVHWDLHYAPPVKLTPEQKEALAAGFFFGAPRGPLVDPGEYTVKVTVGQHEATKTVQVEEDPRVSISPADRAARTQAVLQLYEMYKAADKEKKTITGLKASLDAALASWKKPNAPKIPENIQKAGEALAKKVDEFQGDFVPPSRPLGFAGAPLHYTPPPLPQRIGRLMFALEGYTAAPTPPQAEELRELSTLLSEKTARLKALVDEDLANLNKAMNEAGLPHIVVGEAPPAKPEENEKGAGALRKAVSP